MTLVLIHGAGNTSRVWQAVQAQLRYPSVAVDLPGRRDRVASIAAVTIDEATASAGADVDAVARGPLILVGHSAGGILLPQLAAKWADRVQALVFVAGLSAPDGQQVAGTVRPDAVTELASRLAALREQFTDCMLDPVADAHGMTAIDAATAMGIDSLNYLNQTVSWDGVPNVPRIFVRCLRDRIQPRQLQAKLIDTCAATTVIDLDSGHTPAHSAPHELAEILNAIAEKYAS